MARITYILQKSIIAAWLIIFGVVSVFAYWGFDRDPPFTVESYTISNAVPGGIATVEAKVQRDIGRECTATFSRYLIDSRGTRVELTGMQYSTAAAIHQMERLTPGRLKFAVEVPLGVAKGPAKVVSSTEYICNPIQRLWPIDLLINMDMEIL